MIAPNLVIPNLVIKVCGVTTAEDARAAVEAGANAIGFNFWPRSPRYLAPGQAAGVVAAAGDALKVGVFVDEPAAGVAAIARELGLDVVQLHGRAEAPAGLRVWRAWSVDEDFRAEALPEDFEAFLFDTPAGKLAGGTGRSFDWERLAGVRQRYLVAGGLDASNVGEAIERLRPWGVDACSRLESAPGKKDHAKVRAFVEQALAAATVKQG